jgi:hypothetical protein
VCEVCRCVDVREGLELGVVQRRTFLRDGEWKGRSGCVWMYVCDGAFALLSPYFTSVLPLARSISRQRRGVEAKAAVRRAIACINRIGEGKASGVNNQQRQPHDARVDAAVSVLLLRTSCWCRISRPSTPTTSPPALMDAPRRRTW